MMNIMSVYTNEDELFLIREASYGLKSLDGACSVI